MPPLQVKDCPQDVYEKLRECAQRDNRSMAQQTLTILQEYLGMREASSGLDAWTTQSKRSMESSPLGGHIDPRGTSYLHEDTSSDYLTRYKETLKRIDALPTVPVTKTRPRADILLAEIREEETH